MAQICGVCGEPLGEEDFIECSLCHRQFHLAMYESSSMKDCGTCIMNAHTGQARFFCNTCFMDTQMQPTIEAMVESPFF